MTLTEAEAFVRDTLAQLCGDRVYPIPLRWNGRLRAAFGRTVSTRAPAIVNLDAPNLPAFVAPHWHVRRIELGSKFWPTLTDQQRRTLLLHEACHAAVIINHDRNGWHGPLWVSYMRRAGATHLRTWETFTAEQNELYHAIRYPKRRRTQCSSNAN